MSDAIRFAFFGATHPHAQLQIKTLQLMDDVESIALVDDDADAAIALAGKSPAKIEPRPLTLDEALERDDLGFVFADFPTDRNGPAVLQALKAGKHVMSEKPVAISSTLIAEIVEAARVNGRTLSVCYQNRQQPIVRDMRRAIAEGAIGRIMNTECRLITSQVKFRDPGHWLFDRRRSGGGILSWLMCHNFDLLRYMLQDEIVEVSAIVGTLSGEAIDVEDTASGALRFRSGAIGAFNAGYLISASAEGYEVPVYDSYLGFRGTDGSMRWEAGEDGPVLHIESSRPQGGGSTPSRSTSYPTERGEGYGGASGIAFVRRFIRAALHGEEPPTRGEDALQIARIIEACYESSEHGRTAVVD